MNCEAKKTAGITVTCLLVFAFLTGLSGRALGGHERLFDLVEREGAGAVPELMEALEDDSPFIRLTAARLLIGIGEPALEGLEKASEHPDSGIRRMADHGLKKVRMIRGERLLEEGSVLVFNGQDSYVKADGDVSVGSGDFTYELWFKPSDVEKTQGLMGRGRGDNPGRRGINLRYDNNRIEFYAANRNEGGRIFRYSLEDVKDRWVHVAVSVNRKGKAKLFLNGITVDEEDVTGFGDDDGFDTRDFVVGRRPFSDIWHFCGAISEVRVWGAVRTEEDIRENMSRELTGGEDGLLLYWPLDEGEGTAAHDMTENEKHGQISGAAWEIK